MAMTCKGKHWQQETAGVVLVSLLRPAKAVYMDCLVDTSKNGLLQHLLHAPAG